MFKKLIVCLTCLLSLLGCASQSENLEKSQKDVIEEKETTKTKEKQENSEKEQKDSKETQEEVLNDKKEETEKKDTRSTSAQPNKTSSTKDNKTNNTTTSSKTQNQVTSSPSSSKPTTESNNTNKSVPTQKEEVPSVACPNGIDQNQSCEVILDSNYYFATFSSESEAANQGQYYLDEVMYIGNIEITNYSIQPVYRNNRSIAYYGLNLWSNGTLIQ